MAVTRRSVRVVGNPARRKRHHRRNSRHRRRNLSAKQIKYFGTPQQKAALRRKNRSKYPRHHKRKLRAATRHVRRHRRNPGEILSLTLPMGNPARRRRKARNGRRKKGASTMAATHRRRRRRANAGGHRRRRHHKRYAANTHHRRRSRRRNSPRVRYVTRRRHSHRRRRNVGGGFGGGFGAEIMDTLWMVGGAVGTKMLTQMVLGTNNTGLIGYAGNGVAGFALSFLFSKVFKMPKAGRAIFKGAVLQIVLRAISDYTPFGQYTSSLGVGDYQASGWLAPQIYADPNNSAQIRYPAALLAAIAPPPSKGGGMGAAPFTSNYDMGTGNYN